MRCKTRQQRVCVWSRDNIVINKRLTLCAGFCDTVARPVHRHLTQQAHYHCWQTTQNPLFTICDVKDQTIVLFVTTAYSYHLLRVGRSADTEARPVHRHHDPSAEAPEREMRLSTAFHCIHTTATWPPGPLCLRTQDEFTLHCAALLPQNSSSRGARHCVLSHGLQRWYRLNRQQCIYRECSNTQQCLF
jgi:hypothetical protein